MVIVHFKLTGLHLSHEWFLSCYSSIYSSWVKISNDLQCVLFPGYPIKCPRALPNSIHLITTHQDARDFCRRIFRHATFELLKGSGTQKWRAGGQYFYSVLISLSESSHVENTTTIRFIFNVHRHNICNSDFLWASNLSH